MKRECVHTVTVNYDLSIADMIAAGRYDQKSDEINELNFPTQGRGTNKAEITLFHFGERVYTDAVLAELDKHGYRPATLPELLALGADQTDLLRQFPIVALGSIVPTQGCDFDSAYLDWYRGERYLLLHSDWRGWGHNYRFAAVRKYTPDEIVKGLVEAVRELGGNDDNLRLIVDDPSVRQNIAKLLVSKGANGSSTSKQ